MTVWCVFNYQSVYFFTNTVMSVFGESLAENRNSLERRLQLQPQIWGMIESKQCEDELDVIISFD